MFPISSDTLARKSRRGRQRYVTLPDLPPEPA